MEAHRRTDFGPRGLILRAAAAADGDRGGAREIDFFTAEVHYWRLDPDDWPRCLAAVKKLGFELVSTYCPWGVHETAKGALDWSGARDLPRFLGEVTRAGLLAVVKPGPHINAELTHFGFPARVVSDPDMQARTATGTPVWMPTPPHMFPVPSYASSSFRAAAEGWLGALARVVAPLRWPDGPVVAFQVDNEAQMFFRLGAFDHDYHPDALAWWREHAGDVAPPRSWSPTGVPPDAAESGFRQTVRGRSPAGPGAAAEWVRFKEIYTARALAWITAALDDGGLRDLARYTNAPPSPPELIAPGRAARAIGGPVGGDFYHRARDHAEVRRRALYLGATGWPLPIACEVGVGGPPWLPPMTAEDQAQVTSGVLAGGARGASFFMVVDRDRWYGAPIATDGSERPPAAWLAGLLRGLRAVEWTSLRRRCRAALVVSRAESRHAIASSLADPLSPVVTELLGKALGPAGAAALARDPAPALHRRWMAAVEAALDRAGLPYALLDEDADDEAWAAHSLLVAPTLARVDRALWRRLRAAAERGAQVIVGPERPERDELDRPLGEEARLPRRAGLMRAGSLEDLDGLAQDLATAASAAWAASAATSATDAAGPEHLPLAAAASSARAASAATSASGAAAHAAVPGDPAAHAAVPSDHAAHAAVTGDQAAHAAVTGDPAAHAAVTGDLGAAHAAVTGDKAAHAAGPDHLRLADDWRVDPPLQLSIFEDVGGAVRVVALGNPGAQAVRARIHAPPGALLRDLVTGHPLPDLGAIELAAHGVRLCAVVRPR